MSEAIRQDHVDWPAWVVPWDDTSPGVTDMSFLLDHPAGSKGFVRNVDGHFGFDDGTRWRMWALNTCLEVALPLLDVAPILARRLAKYGVNCLRLHAMDQRFPNGLLMRSKRPDKAKRYAGEQDEDTRSLDPEALARLDYFVLCCKREGIYLDLNLNVARVFTEADGVPEAAAVRWGKGLTYFYPRLIELQKEYATQVLTHVNPWTGLDYAHEPAIALIELVNENSLIENWFRGITHAAEPGYAAVHSNWSPIPTGYSQELDKQWNAWLTNQYGGLGELRDAWGGDSALSGDLSQGENPWLNSVRRLRQSEFADANKQRFADEAQFYTDTEKRYFRTMRDHLKRCGAEQLVLGTSDHHHGWSGLPWLEANATLDVTDGHFYWQHPQSHTPGQHWAHDDWWIGNTPMVDQPEWSVVPTCSRAKVTGKPFIVSEVDEPFPHENACEFVPIIAAYGALQDWDGIVFYGFHGMWSPGFWTDRLGQTLNECNTFGYAQDPVKWSQVAVGALMFLRGDVRAAKKLVSRTVTQAIVMESVRQPACIDEPPFWMDPRLARLALEHRIEISDFHADETLPRIDELLAGGDVTTSDTGELTWRLDEGQGSVTVDTPRHQAAVGRAGDYATANMAVRLVTRFAAVQLASLEDAPIATASTLLLVAGARVANTGMRWQDAEHTTLGDQWGEAPSLFEPVQAEIALSLEGASSVMAQALDPHGQPMGEAVALDRAGEGWRLETRGLPPTVWYHLAVRR